MTRVLQYDSELSVLSRNSWPIDRALAHSWGLKNERGICEKMLMEHKTLSPPKFHPGKHIARLWQNVNLTPFLQPTQSKPFVFLWVLFLMISNICLLKIHPSILKYSRNIIEINTFLKYICSYEEALFLSPLCSYSSLTEEPHFQVVEMVLVNLGFRSLHERISQRGWENETIYLLFIKIVETLGWSPQNMARRWPFFSLC